MTDWAVDQSRGAVRDAGDARGRSGGRIAAGRWYRASSRLRKVERVSHEHGIGSIAASRRGGSGLWKRCCPQLCGPSKYFSWQLLCQNRDERRGVLYGSEVSSQRRGGRRESLGVTGVGEWCEGGRSGMDGQMAAVLAAQNGTEDVSRDGARRLRSGGSGSPDRGACSGRGGDVARCCCCRPGERQTTLTLRNRGREGDSVLKRAVPNRGKAK